MLLRNTNLEYIKHNRVQMKVQKEVMGILKNFFENIKRTVKELKGYTILENIEDDKELLF
jgi:hypothetical protein